jgi:hypothetical protein
MKGGLSAFYMEKLHAVDIFMGTDSEANPRKLCKGDVERWEG